MKNFRIGRFWSKVSVAISALMALVVVACSTKKNKEREKRPQPVRRDTAVSRPPIRSRDDLPICMYGVPYQPYRDSIAPVDEVDETDLPPQEELQE